MSFRVFWTVSLHCIFLLALLGCTRPEPEAPLPLLPPAAGHQGVAPPRVNGGIGAPRALPPAQVSVSAPATIRLAENRPTETEGEITLDFADTDIREIVAQILGNVLRVTYTIDPAVHGTATMRTPEPIPRSQLLSALQTMLSQNGATLVQSGNIYRVLPITAAGGPQLAGDAATTGGTLVPLRYASAEDLAKLLQPYVQTNAKVIANTGANALVISGDPTARDALVSLVQAFDVDALAGQSYALFPVENGTASDFATALQTAFRSREGGALASVVRVVAMQRINSVLVIAPQPRLIEDARLVYALVARNRRQTIRSWRVYYLQNGRANDVAYVMQQALTPNHVTAQPTTPTQLPNQGTSQSGGGGGASNGIGGIAGLGTSGGTATGLGATGGGTMGGGLAGGGLAGGGAGVAGVAPGRSAPGQAANQAANPLLGGLGGEAGTAGAEAEEMRIIPDPANNSLLIYGTAQELETAEAMLHKVDILPLQVRIDAVIAEVDLNDTLRYGTQFYFNAGITGALSFGPSVNEFLKPLPGFILSGPGGTSALLDALQDVTKVRVLSSPQLLVLDNQAARIQVGSLVPYQTQSSQSVLAAGAPIINSIDYRETGVIMDVTPRVNTNGLVTMDIAQEVSAVQSIPPPNAVIASPTFSERAVQSRVVVQDGQTMGLAGLISDQVSKENAGIPWLKDVPVLGLLAGRQNNTRTRTELLVLLTPHVIHDQRDARAMTEDLREGLRQAASVPGELRRLPQSGSADPSRPLRRQLHLEQ